MVTADPRNATVPAIEIASWARVMFGLALCLALAPAAAQTRVEQGQKELTRKVPAGTVQACTLLTRAEVEKATGRDPYADPEPAGQGGWICNVGIAELKVYSGPKSEEAWESTLKGFGHEKAPRTPAAGFGSGAYFIYMNAASPHRPSAGILVAKSGAHTLVLSVDAARGSPAESTRPALESLMKSVIARLG
jgi:hypothetical protein